MAVALHLTVWPLLVTLVSCGGGWLDRVVQYHKQKFIQDLKDTLPSVDDKNYNESLQAVNHDPTSPVNRTQSGKPKVSLQPLPEGFQDHPEWDVDSVGRLLDLLHTSPSGRRVLRALRRSMLPTRRWMINKPLSYKLFPSIDSENYYLDSGEEEPEYPDYPKQMTNITDNTLVTVDNPVECKLPSGHISIAMLRRILEQRAGAARIMPNTTVNTVTWPVFTGRTKKKANGTATTVAGTVSGMTTTPATNDSSTGTGEGSSTGVSNTTPGGSGGTDTSPGSGGSDTTPTTLTSSPPSGGPDTNPTTPPSAPPSEGADTTPTTPIAPTT